MLWVEAERQGCTRIIRGVSVPIGAQDFPCWHYCSSEGHPSKHADGRSEIGRWAVASHWPLPEPVLNPHIMYLLEREGDDEGNAVCRRRRHEARLLPAAVRRRAAFRAVHEDIHDVRRSVPLLLTICMHLYQLGKKRSASSIRRRTKNVLHCQ